MQSAIIKLSEMLSATTLNDKKRGRAIAKRLNEIFAPCPMCNDTGINHGVQCKPTKKHPYGWKSEACDCGIDSSGHFAKAPLFEAIAMDDLCDLERHMPDFAGGTALRTMWRYALSSEEDAQRLRWFLVGVMTVIAIDPKPGVWSDLLLLADVADEHFFSVVDGGGDDRQ